MIRKHESTVSWKSGMLALAVHGVLLIAMIVSVDWKAAHAPMQVTEVTLWSELPATKSMPVKVEPPKPEPSKPEPSPILNTEPKIEPKVELEKPKDETPEVDIALEKKKQEKIEKDKQAQEKLMQEKVLEEQRKLDEKRKNEALEKLKQEAREDELRAEKAEKKKQEAALKKLQEDSLHEDAGKGEKQASAASASLVAEFTDKIKAKVRGNVNKTLCGDGNPELRFDISLLPSGELASSPKLVKSSGNEACDEAVERAIMASEPLPLPEEAAAKAQFRNLKLKFRPND